MGLLLYRRGIKSLFINPDIFPSNISQRLCGYVRNQNFVFAFVLVWKWFRACLKRSENLRYFNGKESFILILSFVSPSDKAPNQNYSSPKPHPPVRPVRPKLLWLGLRNLLCRRAALHFVGCMKNPKPFPAF